MKRVFSGVDAVKRHLQDQIDRCNTRIDAAKKVIAEKQRGRIQRATTEIALYTERRRAFQDALKALNEVEADLDQVVGRLADDTLERVRKALEVIYETTQHGNHDISDGADWATVEGEAGDALNLLNDMRREGQPYASKVAGRVLQRPKKGRSNA